MTDMDRDRTAKAAPAPAGESLDARFVREVLRINDRYTREIVEGFDVCPFARSGRQSGRTAREVLLQRDNDPGPCVDTIERLESGREDLEVVQVIFPRLQVDPTGLERFNAAVIEGRARRPGKPLFVHATFHPDYPCDPRSPDSLVAFFRRSPDPMIQLVRFAVIQAVRRHEDHGTQLFDPARLARGELPEERPLPVPDRIARDNHARILRDGPEVLQRIYDSIRAERREAYAAFEEATD